MPSLMNLPPGLLAQFGLPQADPTQAPPMANKMTGKPMPQPAIAMGPGGMNLNPAPPPPPGVAPGMNIPSAPMPRGAAFGPSPGAPPQSSDDPGITGMPALPTPPDISKSPVGPANAQFQADSAKVKAFGPAPSPQDFKPSVGRRIGGGLLGALGGGLASLAGEKPEDAVKTGESQGDAFTNRKFNNATGNYQRGMAAAQKAVDLDKEGLPFAEAAGKLPQQDFENKLGVSKEGREQQTANATISSKNDLSDIRQQLADTAKIRESDQKEQALSKLQQDLELRSKGLDLKQMSLEQQKQFQDLSNQLKEQKQENDRQKFAVGTDAKSLEDERKARLTSIENDWKEHPYWNKLTGNKNKDIQAVNDDINQRLAGVRSASGGQAGQIQVTDPRGHIHTFANQQQADSFKRQAGIK